MNHRTFDQCYVILLYTQYKLNQFFDIYINNKRIPMVSEIVSLENTNSGNIHYVYTESKVKKRKLPNKSDSSNWKQNGVEVLIAVDSMDNSFSASKKSLTYQGDKINSVKLWEYSLIVDWGAYTYKVLIRHYLQDDQSISKNQKYTTNTAKLSLVPKQQYSSIFNNQQSINFGSSDYQLIDNLYNHALLNSKQGFPLIDINKHLFINDQDFPNKKKRLLKKEQRSIQLPTNQQQQQQQIFQLQLQYQQQQQQQSSLLVQKIQLDPISYQQQPQQQQNNNQIIVNPFPVNSLFSKHSPLPIINNKKYNTNNYEDNDNEATTPPIISINNYNHKKDINTTNNTNNDTNDNYKLNIQFMTL